MIDAYCKIKQKLKKGIILVQTFPVEGKNGLLEGGSPHSIMHASQLLKHLREHENLDVNEKISVIGIGATAGLWDEITFDGKDLYKIFGTKDGIKSEKISLDTPISFSQVGICNVKGITKTIKIDKICAKDLGDENAYEINRGGVFEILLNLIGKEQSAVISINAKTNYLKTRAVCPIVLGTNNKVVPPLDFAVMIVGGVAIRDGDKVIKTFSNNHQDKNEIKQAIIDAEKKQLQVQYIKGQDISIIQPQTPQEVRMVGVLTGTEMAENKALEGIHLHSKKYGHVLALGDLIDVTLEITPIRKTMILMPEKDLKGNYIWREALKK